MLSNYPKTLPDISVVRVSALSLCFVLAAGAFLILPSEASAQETREEQARAEYMKGVYLLEDEAPAEALQHFLIAWQYSDGEPIIGEKLAETYFRMGDLVNCKSVLKEVLTKDGSSRTALRMMAKVNYLSEDTAQALDDLRALKESGDKSFETQRLYAKVLFELGRDEESLKAYEDAIAIDPNYPFLHYTHALLLRKFGRIEDAKTALENAVKLEPRFVDASLELASLLLQEGNIADAAGLLENVLAVDPENYGAILMTSELYLEQDKVDDAIRLLEGAAQSGSLPREGILMLGRAYYEAEDFAEAFKLFKRLYDGGAKSSDMARVLGEISLKNGESDKALGYYREAIALGPDGFRNYMALFFASSKRFGDSEAPTIPLSQEESLGLLGDAAKHAGEEDHDAHYMLGIAFQSIDAYDEAARHLERAVALNPEEERVHLNLAAVLERLGRYDEAEAHVIPLHKQKPDDATVCNFYGYLLSLMGKDLDKAEALVRTALKSEPKNGYYTDSLGWVFYKRGDFERAVLELEKAVNLASDDPVILEHLGDAYKALRRYRKALAAYEKSGGLEGHSDEIFDKIDETQKELHQN